MFILACLSIIPLAGLMGEGGTEEISFYAGPKIGGFLNGTFGNATDINYFLFCVKSKGYLRLLNHLLLELSSETSYLYWVRAC